MFSTLIPTLISIKYLKFKNDDRLKKMIMRKSK